jgi:RIO-like serine/threonine protein kinase
MSLSIKNGWQDDQDRTYIIYTVEQIAEDLGCGKDKAIIIKNSENQNSRILKIRPQGFGKTYLKKSVKPYLIILI